MKLLLNCIFVLFLTVGFAQNTITVNIYCNAKNCHDIIITETPAKFNSLNEAEVFLNNLSKELQKKGYLAAAFDSVVQKENTMNAWFNPGPLFKISAIQFEHIDEEALKYAGFHKYNQKANIFKTDELQKIMFGIVSYYENNGYPFASVFFNNLELNNDSISATLACEKGALIKIDSIVNNGNLDISAEVLYDLLQISPGDVYNEKAIVSISEKIKKHRFIREKAAPKIIFRENSAVIYVNLDMRPVNTFDGIIGFMPDYRDEGKLFLTGELMLSVTNALSLAETIKLKWRQPEKNSQDLRASLNLPFLIYIPLGFSWNLFLIKKDTSSVNVDNKFAFHYNKMQNAIISTYMQIFSSSLISTKQFQQITSLPPVNDMKISSLGIAVEIEKLDNRYNPLKGFAIITDVAAGKKTILKNAGLNPDLYENINLNSVTYKAQTDIMLFVPLKGKSTMHVRQFSGILFSEEIFLNEMFQLGGLSSIRGFDENLFYASFYAAQTIEYRYLFDENSRFVLFADYAYMERNSTENFLIQRPLGIGAGVSLETNSGIFSLYYGVGKLNNAPFDFKSSKIHFGYMVVF